MDLPNNDGETPLNLAATKGGGQLSQGFTSSPWLPWLTGKFSFAVRKPVRNVHPLWLAGETEMVQSLLEGKAQWLDRERVKLIQVAKSCPTTTAFCPVESQ